MKHVQLRFGKGLHVVFGNRRAQVAEMVIEPGDAEGGADNRHRGADQWLYVVSGTGSACINGERVPLRRGVLLLIEQRDRHEIRNTGRGLLKHSTTTRRPLTRRRAMSCRRHVATNPPVRRARTS